MKSSYTITVGKIGQTWEVDFASLPQVSKEYIIQRGFDHLNDCHAGIHLNAKDKHGNSLYEDEDAVAEAVQAAMDSRVNSLKSGEIANRSSGGAKTRLLPLDAEIHRMAREMVVDRIKASGSSVKVKGEEYVVEMTKLVVAKYDSTLRPKAQAVLDARKNAPEVDLDSLLAE